LKKIVLFLTFLWGHLFAMDAKSTINVYYELFSSMTQKEKLSVYVMDKELKEIFSQSKHFVVSQDPSKADVVLLTDETSYITVKQALSKHKSEAIPIFFTTDYHLLEDHPEIIGALYWKKGRSQLLFIKPRLQVYHIDLPQEYDPFIIESL